VIDGATPAPSQDWSTGIAAPGSHGAYTVKSASITAPVVVLVDVDAIDCVWSGFAGASVRPSCEQAVSAAPSATTAASAPIPARARARARARQGRSGCDGTGGT
jgi:hypothetical protein